MKKQSGQAMIEYLLMIVVVAVIAYGAYEKINTFFFEQGGFLASYFDGASDLFSDTGGLNLKYKRFSLRR